MVFCAGSLAFIGYLGLLARGIDGELGPTLAHLGLASAAVDAIPVMFAGLGMDRRLNHAPWLLVTLTTAAGGSLTAIGSAAGVAPMGVGAAMTPCPPIGAGRR